MSRTAALRRVGGAGAGATATVPAVETSYHLPLRSAAAKGMAAMRGNPTHSMLASSLCVHTGYKDKDAQSTGRD